MKGLKEIKSFWKTYDRLGVCAIDPAHRFALMDGIARFETLRSNTRKRFIRCACCGVKLQVRVTVLKSRHISLVLANGKEGTPV